MVRSGQDFQCYVSHVNLPWHPQNAVAGGGAAGSGETREAGCQAQHCQHRVPLSLAGAGQAAFCLTHGGPVGSWGSRGELVQLVARKAGLLLGEEGVSLQLMTFVPPRLGS